MHDELAAASSHYYVLCVRPNDEAVAGAPADTGAAAGAPAGAPAGGGARGAWDGACVLRQLRTHSAIDLALRDARRLPVRLPYAASPSPPSSPSSPPPLAPPNPNPTLASVNPSFRTPLLRCTPAPCRYAALAPLAPSLPEHLAPLPAAQLLLLLCCGCGVPPGSVALG